MAVLLRESSLAMYLIGFGLMAIVVAVVLHSIYRLEKQLSHQQAEIDLLKQRIVDLDPQFDDERILMNGFNEAMAKGEMTLLGSAHADLVRKKEEEGKPTLFEPFKNID